VSRFVCRRLHGARFAWNLIDHGIMFINVLCELFIVCHR
jgi:hypothetical protein